MCRAATALPALADPGHDGAGVGTHVPESIAPAAGVPAAYHRQQISDVARAALVLAHFDYGSIT
jgi:hypothetical protein